MSELDVEVAAGAAVDPLEAGVEVESLLAEAAASTEGTSDEEPVSLLPPDADGLALP